MKKQLSSALLTIGLISFNVMPARAFDQVKASTSGQWCVEIPMMGIFCWEL